MRIALCLSSSLWLGAGVWAAMGVAAPGAIAQAPPDGDVLAFSEDFENGLERWRFPYGSGHLVRRTDRGSSLELEVVDLPVYALIEGSEAWGDVRIEGNVLFPTPDDAYLGFIYDYVDSGSRTDFGSMYIKGNGNYVQANDHHDTNVSRTFYPERRSTLTGAQEIEVGRWQRFALEVAGGEAHLYVGDLTRPALTLPRPGSRGGAVGFKPRNPGWPVLIDDIRVHRINGPTWEGPAQPDVPYDREAFLTQWWVLGPTGRYVESPDLYTGRDVPLLDAGGTELGWRRLDADDRGAVPTGTVVEYRGERRVAYFRTRARVSGGDRIRLALSTVDDLAVWVNGRFAGFAPGQSAAWWDAPRNPERGPLAFSELLPTGDNVIVVRVVGGAYARGGFYMWLAPGP